MRIASAAILALLILTSCQKELVTSEESINAETVSSDAAGPGEFANCKLRRIVHEHGGVRDLLINGLFTYNSAGNPISLTYVDGGTGNPNQYFFYDKQNRLREWRSAYDPNSVMESYTHKYGYDQNGVLAVDTFLFHAKFDWNEENQDLIFTGWGDTTVSLLTYDSQGRVVKESIRDLSTGKVRNPTYTYDNRGNIGVLGWRSSSYDNKVSIYRAHPVFQFIFRNYSRNNAAPVAKYNSRGLPLSVDGTAMNDNFFQAYPAFPADYYKGGIYKLIYDCQ